VTSDSALSDLNRDLLDVWDTLHKTRTILIDVTDAMEEEAAKTRILGEIEFLAKAQTRLAKHLADAGVGLDAVTGASGPVMPGAASFSRAKIITDP
jgi:hypothetical protein